MTDNSNTPLVKATPTDINLQHAETTDTSTSHADSSAQPVEADKIDRTRVELLAEEIGVEKQQRIAGEVQISKRIVEVQVQVPVTLRREEITVTHNQNQALPDPSGAADGDVFKEETFTIILHEEVPTVTKTTRVYEVVEVQKRVLTQEKTITDSVRREEADIKQTGRVRVVGDTTKDTSQS